MGGVLLDLGLNECAAKVSDQGVVEVVDVSALTRDRLRVGVCQVLESAVHRGGILVISSNRKGINRLIGPLLSSQRVCVAVIMSTNGLVVKPLGFSGERGNEFQSERCCVETFLAILIDRADALTVEGSSLDNPLVLEVVL